MNNSLSLSITFSHADAVEENVSVVTFDSRAQRWRFDGDDLFPKDMKLVAAVAECIAVAKDQYPAERKERP